MILSVTTPRGALVQAEVDEVIAPGALGEFGILPGHVPFLSALRPGVFVYRIKDSQHVLAVNEGVLEVARTEGGDKVLVLVSDAANASDVDQTAAAKDVATADSELAHWSKDLGGEYKTLVTRRAWAAARLDAASRVAPH